MSDKERTIWNERFADGAYENRTYPNTVLKEWIEFLPKGKALDVACGAGRDSIFLAQNGFDVTGTDISSVALARAETRARQEGLKINWCEHDLDSGLSFSSKFDVILMIRFMNNRLLEALPRYLNPGGALLVEEHLSIEHPTPLAGPQGSRFRVVPEELKIRLQELKLERYFEGLITEPNGNDAAVARILAFSQGFGND